MTLLIVFAAVAAALFALLWGLSLILQGALYNTPADHLPARAAVGAAVMAAFLTLWVSLDRKSPGRYGTFFEFSPYDSREFDEFEAVRWSADPAARARGKQDVKKDADGKPLETVTKFRRGAGNKAAPFAEPGSNKPFHLQEPGVMTAAIIAKADDAGPPVRFDAVIKKDDRTGVVYATDEKRFEEAKGSRYVNGVQPGVVFSSSTGAVFGAIALNVLHYALWFALFWPVLRFGVGPALLMAAGFGLVTMLLVMPVLFKPGRTPAVVPVPVVPTALAVAPPTPA